MARNMIRGLMTGSLLLFSFTAPSLAQDVAIAGIAPDKRPQNAPVITRVSKDGNWYKRALTGVVAPYPYSLRFLEDQGNWFNPFIHPGMHGPYDIRGWHKKN